MLHEASRLNLLFWHQLELVNVLNVLKCAAGCDGTSMKQEL
jgi:hypothetical protein